MDTAKVTVLTIIAVFELEDRLVNDLQSFGIRAYTLGRVVGRGEHGPRMSGLVDAPNLKLELLVSPDMALGVLEHLRTQYVNEALIAYVQGAEAIPVEHFR